MDIRAIQPPLTPQNYFGCGTARAGSVLDTNADGRISYEEFSKGYDNFQSTLKDRLKGKC